LRSHEPWIGVLAFDEFSQSTFAHNNKPWGPKGPWTDDDDLRAADWLQRKADVNLPTRVVAEAVQVVAHQNRFDPLLRYLDIFVWDGTPRIDTWLTRYLGAESSRYTAAIGAKWLYLGDCPCV
jgi:putative DNA primase/helicase